MKEMSLSVTAHIGTDTEIKVKADSVGPALTLGPNPVSLHGITLLFDDEPAFRRFVEVCMAALEPVEG